MDDDNKYYVQDLIANAIDQKPTEFENAFNNLITDRIRSAIENRKIEIAKNLYNYNNEVEDAETEEETSEEE